MDKDNFMKHITADRRKWLRIARTMLPERDCEDALQCAMLSAWQHLPQLKDDHAFQAWFRQILVNQCRQIQREYRREQTLLSSLCIQEPMVDSPNEYLNEAMEQLSEDEQALIRLHHEQGYTLKEISKSTGHSEDVLKMRLYRARKRLKVALITLLLMLMMTAVAAGLGLIDINWFLQHRRAEKNVIHQAMPTAIRQFSYSGKYLIAEASDAMWNTDIPSLSFVYALASADPNILSIHSDNLGVDGVHLDHVWHNDQIVPLAELADGKTVLIFSVDDWKLSDTYLHCSVDFLSDGKGEVFYIEAFLDSLEMEQYKKLIGKSNLLTLTATLALQDSQSGALVESGVLTLQVDAPVSREWRKPHETHAE